MNGTITAGLWGLVGGSALLLGAAVPFLVNLPQRLIAAIMAVGSGVLISAVAFDLMDEAYRQGGFAASALGFVAGAAAYTAANVALSRRGARHRTRASRAPTRRAPASPSRSARCWTGYPNRSSSASACSTDRASASPRSPRSSCPTSPRACRARRA